MSNRPAKGLTPALSNLPSPPPGSAIDPSTIKHFRDLNVALARELNARPRRGELTQLLLFSPSGSLFEIRVADDGTLSASQLFEQTP